MASPIAIDDAYQQPEPRQHKIFDNLDINKIISGESQIFDFDINIDGQEKYSHELSDERENDAYYGVGLESQLISKTFSELSKEMISLDPEGLIKKMILKKGKQEKSVDRNGKTRLNYDLYTNGKEKPFDYSRDNEHSPTYYSPDSFVIGIDNAIRSMEVGEKSQFIINWSLAFGKLGCIPLVPPEADILAVIELIEVVPFYKNPIILQGNSGKFHSKIQQVKVLQMQAKEAFQKNNLKLSLSKYNDAMIIINWTSTDKNEEKDELKSLKISFHLNLAVVHNKLKNAKKALYHCDHALRLDQNNQKAIFHRGRAFIQMNEFTKATNELIKGQRMFPQNISFGKELLKVTWRFRLAGSVEYLKEIKKI